MGIWSKRMSLKSQKRMSVDERARARKSVAHARGEFLKARKDARLEANEFAKTEEGDLELQGKLCQLNNTPWYLFWQKASKMPQELNLWNGETATWQQVASSSIEEVSQAAEETEGWSEAKKVFWLSDVMCESNVSNKSSSGAPTFLRVTATLQIPPRVVLLTQIRAELRGQADPNLVYLREHYKFRFGRTHLFHSIGAAPAKFSSPRDYCDISSWEEFPDGTIVFGEKSVTNCIKKKSVKGCVRGITRIRGMVIKPEQVEVSSLLGGKSTVEGSRVTFLISVDPKGWLPKGIVNMSARKSAAQFLLNCESVGLKVVKSGQVEELIKRFVTPYAPDEVKSVESPVAEEQGEEEEVEGEA